MTLNAPEIAKLSQPGQFITTKIKESGADPLLRIPLGIHRVSKKTIRLLYKVVGEGTKLFAAKKKGEEVSILGPLGNGFKLENSEAIIVAGGHGVAPLYFLAEELIKKKKKVDFFVGAGTKDHILCVKELKKIGVKVHIATEDGTQGRKGYVTALIEDYLKRVTRRVLHATFYACGPKPMLLSVADIAKKWGLSAQISLDAYMACGFGACLGCAVRAKNGYKLVCKDGPVFDAEEIVWDESNSKNQGC